MLLLLTPEHVMHLHNTIASCIYFGERQIKPYTAVFFFSSFFHSVVSLHGHICQPVTFNLSLIFFPIMASHCILSPSLDTL